MLNQHSAASLNPLFGGYPCKENYHPRQRGVDQLGRKPRVGEVRCIPGVSVLPALVALRHLLARRVLYSPASLQQFVMHRLRSQQIFDLGASVIPSGGPFLGNFQIHPPGNRELVCITSYFLSSPVNSQSTDLPNSRLMASRTAEPGSFAPSSSADKRLWCADPGGVITCFLHRRLS